MSAIASSASPPLSEYEPRDLAITAWSYSSWAFDHRPLLAAIASSAIPPISEFEPRALANTAWSFAPLSWPHEPLLDSISSAAIRTIREFEEQGCANTAFAFASLGLWHHEPLFDAIASQAIALLRCEHLEPGPGCYQLLDVMSELVRLNRSSNCHQRATSLVSTIADLSHSTML